MLSARELTHLHKGDWRGQYGVIPTPGHSPRDRGTIVADRMSGDGVFIYCFNGDWRDAWRALGLGRCEETREPTADERARYRLLKQKEQNERARKIARARDLFAAARPIHLVKSTIARDYLEARCIAPPWPASVRYHANVSHPFADRRRTFPALVLGVAPLDSPHDICGVQRIYLQAGGRKADVEEAKVTLGRIRGCAVLLGACAESLVIGEGFETTASASAALGPPGAAVLGSRNMPNLVLPARVRHVLVAYDRDEHGESRAQAEKFVETARAEERRFYPRPPPKPFNDWNDWAQHRKRRDESEA